VFTVHRGPITTHIPTSDRRKTELTLLANPQRSHSVTFTHKVVTCQPQMWHMSAGLLCAVKHKFHLARHVTTRHALHCWVVTCKLRSYPNMPFVNYCYFLS